MINAENKANKLLQVLDNLTQLVTVLDGHNAAASQHLTNQCEQLIQTCTLAQKATCAAQKE